MLAGPRRNDEQAPAAPSHYRSITYSLNRAFTYKWYDVIGGGSLTRRIEEPERRQRDDDHSHKDQRQPGKARRIRQIEVFTKGRRLAGIVSFFARARIQLPHLLPSPAPLTKPWKARAHDALANSPPSKRDGGEPQGQMLHGTVSRERAPDRGLPERTATCRKLSRKP